MQPLPACRFALLYYVAGATGYTLRPDLRHLEGSHEVDVVVLDTLAGVASAVVGSKKTYAKDAG